MILVRGPYRSVRNPRYLGAGLAVIGAALFYRSPVLVGYLLVLAAAVSLFILLHEEPPLTRLFGADYADDRVSVHRWLARVPRA